MWFDYNSSVKQSHSGLGSQLCRFFLLAVAIAFGFTVGYSRVFLGMHTMDQILFGWLLGVWFAFTFHFCSRTALTQNAQTLLDTTATEFAKYSIWCTVLFIAALTLEMVNYFIFNPRIVISETWVSLLVQNCGIEVLDDAF